MLFLRSNGDSLARIDAPKPSFWSSVTSRLSKAANTVSKTTKVAAGLFGVGTAVAVSAVSFGAIPLIAGSVLALAGVGIYAYGKITEAIERKSYTKPIFKAPPKDLDFTYIAPYTKPAAPAPVIVAPAPVVAPAPAKKVQAPAKKNSDKENLEMIFPNRGVKLGQKVQPINQKKPLASRQLVLA